jgi:hypothetical protein
MFKAMAEQLEELRNDHNLLKQKFDEFCKQFTEDDKKKERSFFDFISEQFFLL